MSDNSSEKSNNDIGNKIKNLISELREHIVIPCHHYQTKEIVQYNDFIGDSYKLALDCSKSSAEFVIFCGVKFMAEGAAVLAKEGQKVILPHFEAGCPMAEMISGEVAEQAVLKIKEDVGEIPAPIVYMNSYADSKYVCGKYDGSVCSSSNAEKILKHYFDKGRRVFFYPDYFLGANSADKLGLAKDERAFVNKDLTIDYFGDPKKVKIFLWNGYCHVHKKFNISDIEKVRKDYPSVKIIVHPESAQEVVQASDDYGSTAKIYDVVKNSKPGSVWCVGTEESFVRRLASECQDKTIFPLKNSLCVDMSKIGEKELLKSLENIKNYLEKKENLENLIYVPDEYIEFARKSLNNMIQIVEG